MIVKESTPKENTPTKTTTTAKKPRAKRTSTAKAPAKTTPKKTTTRKTPAKKEPEIYETTNIYEAAYLMVSGYHLEGTLLRYCVDNAGTTREARSFYNFTGENVEKRVEELRDSTTTVTIRGFIHCLRYLMNQSYTLQGAIETNLIWGEICE